jgi:ABC-type sugar transport systems, permease components
MKRLKRRWWMFGLPFILWFLLFYIVPFGHAIYYSFIESAFSHRFAGLANYQTVFHNPYYRLAFLNTVKLIAIGVPCLMLLSLTLALIVHKLGEHGRFARAAVILPLLLPSAALTPAFSKMGILSVQVPVYAIYLWKNAGVIMVLLVAALSAIPKEINEAAAIDGASSIKRFLKITLPQLIPALFFAATLAVVYNLRIFRESYLLYGAYPDASLYLMQNYMNNHFHKLNYQNLTAGAVMFAAALHLFVFAAYRFDARRG